MKNTYNVEYHDTVVVEEAETFGIQEGCLIFYTKKETQRGVFEKTAISALAPGWKKIWIVE